MLEDMKCVLKSFKDFKFIMFFGRQDSLEAHLACNLLLKWKEVTDKWCGGKAHNEEILFGLEERLVMIDLNDIMWVLKGDSATNNIMNIFLKQTPLQILNNTWITHVNLMNTCGHYNLVNETRLENY